MVAVVGVGAGVVDDLVQQVVEVAVGIVGAEVVVVNGSETLKEVLLEVVVDNGVL